MGAVYEAEQQQPKRIVALKVIKAAWATHELLRRFEQESQVLARLHHRGIAHIYEAGTAGIGSGPSPISPWSSSLQAKPLTDYARNQNLNLRQLLELMAQVCDAVHHAHQRGIIHHDLKPGNSTLRRSFSGGTR